MSFAIAKRVGLGSSGFSSKMFVLPRGGATSLSSALVIELKFSAATSEGEIIWLAIATMTHERKTEKLIKISRTVPTQSTEKSFLQAMSILEVFVDSY